MQENDLLQQLPKELLRTLHGCRFTKDTLGCSSAVVLHVPEKRSYLKIAPYNPVEPLAVEAAVLEWLQDRLPVPKVHYYEEWQGREYLLISELEGTVCSDAVHRLDPEALARNLAEGLKMIHSVDIAHCPFNQTLEVKLEKARRHMELGLVNEDEFEDEYMGKTAGDLYAMLPAKRPSREDLVFTHGDYCLPNVILKDGKVRGFIDWGRAGVADRYQDIALGVRSLRHNHYPEDLVTVFLEAYGITDPDWGKIEYFILLDEFF